MSLPITTGGYSLGPDEGDALWFNGALLRVKAGAAQTQGRLAAVEFVVPKDFAAPLHIHRDDDEIFLVLAGEVRFQMGETVTNGVSGTFVYGPHGMRHSFHVDSTEARLLLIFGPSGTEEFFREAGKPARSAGLPPAGETFPDRDALIEIARRHGQDFVGPPLPPL
jgi:quercetin dioxygenase-like cupin family protein